MLDKSSNNELMYSTLSFSRSCLLNYKIILLLLLLLLLLSFYYTKQTLGLNLSNVMHFPWHMSIKGFKKEPLNAKALKRSIAVERR